MKKFILLLLIIIITGCKTAELSDGGASQMSKKSLLVVAQNGFQPVEYADTRTELENAGISVEVASLEKAEVIDKDGNSINVDIGIKDVNVEDYDAIVLIGGPGAAQELVGNPDVIELVQAADNAEKIVAAICISPVVLAEARILKDRKATVWNGDGKQEEILAAEGAHYSEESVVVDTRIVTANGPDAAKEFGKAIAELLK
jgi:protease I